MASIDTKTTDQLCLRHLGKKAMAQAMQEGYYDRTNQFLPKENIALVIKGNKVTDDISHPLWFNASIRTQTNTVQVAKRTSGQTKKSKTWTGYILI